MAKTAKNILSLNHEKAMDFFMKSEQYHGFELPEYFTFDEVLKFMSYAVRRIRYEEYQDRQNELLHQCPVSELIT